MNYIDKAEIEILKYFNTTYNGHYYKLIALDKTAKRFYTGVTLHYIFKYVLKKRYSKTNTAAILLNLLNSETIKCLHCPNIDDMVFNNIECPYWEFIIKDHRFCSKGSSDYSVKELKYSKNNIKYLEESYFNKFQS